MDLKTSGVVVLLELLWRICLVLVFAASCFFGRHCTLMNVAIALGSLCHSCPCSLCLLDGNLLLSSMHYVVIISFDLRPINKRELPEEMKSVVHL